MLAGVWLWGAFALLGAGPDAPPVVVDRVVARVDKTVITQSALTAEARLLLLDESTPRMAISAKLSRPLLAAVLRSMVDRALLLNEMRRLQLRPASEEEVAADVSRLARRFETPAGLRAFLIDIGLVDPDAPDVAPFGAPAGIIERLRVEREVQRFVDVRIRPSLVTSEREVRACYEANRARLPGLSLEQAEPRVRARLRAQKEARALEALLDQLRERAKVRVDAAYVVKKAAPEEGDGLGWSCPERVR